MTANDAYTEGRTARRLGDDRTDNPYIDGLHQHAYSERERLWFAGYDDEKEDQREASRNAA